MQTQVDTVQNLINKLVEFFVTYSFQVMGAVIVLIIGLLLANWAQRLMMGVCSRKKLDITLSRFIASIVRMVVLGFAILIALGKFGITIAPFIAALSALAFGASFAVQAPISNYGAGLSIILGRPFVVGDTITVQGVSGVVREVKLATTLLTNEDGTCITIPNKKIVGEIIYNSKANQVSEGVIGVSYEGDPETSVKLIRQMLASFPGVVQEPAPQVGIQKFADSTIDIHYRYWVPTIKFFQLSSAVNLEVYKSLTSAGVKIPFPQRDVHLTVDQPLSTLAAVKER